jgi:hypothetical protein
VFHPTGGGHTDEEAHDPFPGLGTPIRTDEDEKKEERTRNIISQSVKPAFSPFSLFSTASPLSGPWTLYPSLPKYAISRSRTTLSSAVGWWNVCGTVQEGDGVERKDRKSQEDMVTGDCSLMESLREEVRSKVR